ncbi:non-ribosomal peptide synthetase [Bacillus subtilis subsp. subtilis]|uniref:Plipastatin synthase subunit C n=8 Tax=Bacilli TaxID=91061 RepID=PPSC_BACSU|nr:MULTISPECIES: plipastatin non-ribosomal peptide synthetase PpsC [Bacillus]NP_389714.1 non-ribosomal plipastatin synthetase C involved in synthesis of plipastatin [Bacillus subtilis subsp. subtilis str. 168]P39847.2 RecName: Full=Plipastatin synthase subunit C; AltName: Full=Peptide synthase 3; Includes: RecName: Full=ATP-dependent glutamate adenylase 2; Short=GluA 2; AltName: Full=Glutamate activase 2; Includes: RecName: Full=ATP-dependent alanine/valine adenylase; Short=Ala/ValA; AltName: Ful
MPQQPEIQDIYPLSFMQEGMLFHSLYDEQSRAYFEQASFTIHGQLDLERFQKSMDAVFDRYDIFRTAFIYKNVAKPRQVVLKQRHCPIHIEDISHLNERDKEHCTEAFKEQDKSKGFDLQTDVLMRISILKWAPDHYVCIWSHHHILMDGWCLGIVIKDFLHIYQALGKGQLPDLPPVQPYGTYIKWLMQQDREEAAEYWKKRLQHFEKSTPLPKRTDQIPNGTLQQITFAIPEKETAELQKIAAASGATLNTVFQALWGIMLQKVNRSSDAVFGSVISGRPSELKDVENMVGLFINTIPIRAQSDSLSFSDLVRRMQKDMNEAEAYSYFPLYDIQAQSALKQELIDHIIVFENTPTQQEIEELNQAGSFDFSVKDFEMEEVTNYSCSVKVIPGRTLYVRIHFQTSAYQPSMMSEIKDYLLHMVSDVISDPSLPVSKMTLLDEDKTRKIVSQNNRTVSVSPEAPTLHGLFERQAAVTPERLAIRFSGGSLTYAELDMYASRLAAHLAARGVTNESIVGVLSERSPDMLIAVLAVLKAGGAYLPLDPAYPKERLSYMLKDSGASLLLTQPGCSAPNFSGETLEVDMTSLECEEVKRHVSASVSDGSLAYVIYTSGSTGQPKGVAVEHRQAVSFLTGMQHQFRLSEDDIVMVKTSFSFDASVWQLFWWALSGASAYLLPPGWEKDSALIVQAIHQENVTTAHFIPAMLNSFLDQAEIERLSDRTSLKRVFAGGEPLAPRTAARFASVLPQVSLIHGYGPTEATVDAAFYVLDPERDRDRLRIPIGKPVPGARLYVLDPHLAVQPSGVAGELYIAGAGVARGYLNRPALTEERFLEDPFYLGERMYKTGDVARWLPDGNVEFLGRTDDQVKIRGYRIEPGEIEAALRSIEGVREAAVTVRTDSGEPELCAYVEGLQRNEVRAQLQRLLPGYMVPAYMIEMEQWPVTPSGKLDRNALPAPGGAADAETYTAPRNVTEMKLSQLWEDVLKNGPVGIHDNFFDRGGHSLKATALVSRIAKEFDVQVPLKDVFAHPTVEGLATVIREGTDSPYEAIKPAEKQETYPVSSAQKRIYVLQQLEDGGTGYNMPAVLELEGKLNLERMDRAFKELIKRHESLRTAFEQDAGGDPVQRIHDEVPFTLQTTVLGARTEEEAAAAFIKPFDLSQAPLFRAQIVKVSDERHLLLVDMHHIISDGVSVNILIREFGELYNNRKLPALRIQYKDYAVWQEGFKTGDAYKTQGAYWLKQLEGELPVLDLPADHARPPMRSFAGDKVSFTLDQEVTSGLYKLARENGSTLYMVLLAAYTAFLSRLSGQEDIIVGSPIAGRPHKDLEPILGMFVNTLALRTRPEGGKPFVQYLQEVRETAMEAFEHQDYPFEELVDKLELTRDMSRNPLFDVMFVLQNMDQESLELDELCLKPAANNGHQTSKFDLTLYAQEQPRGLLTFQMEFSTDLYKKKTIEKWLQYFNNMLLSIIKDNKAALGTINILNEDEAHYLIHELNRTKIDYPRNETISRLFEMQAEQTPNAVAIVSDTQVFTYEDLNSWANQIASVLQIKGVGPDSVVALLTGRTPELIAGMLGILKAGGAYLPIDSNLPVERIAYMLSDSRAALLLQSEKTEKRLLGIECEQIIIEDIQKQGEAKNVESSAGPHSLAYIIYTSGSTGKPKGVMIEQRSVIRLVKNSNYITFTPEDRLLMTSSIGFDVGSFEIFGPLLNGAALHLSDQQTFLDSHQLKRYIEHQGITTIWLTSSLFNHLTEQNEQTFSQLKHLIIGGEALSPSHVNRIRNVCPEVSIWNGYGPTENTTFSTCLHIQKTYELSIPIGRPVGNSTAFILNQWGVLQPVGAVGELCVGGDGVARGYLGRPDLTKEKFVPHPFAPGDRLYRTGDLARWLSDGTIEYVGRIDDQVKVRGYRVELGEIETALRQIDGVKEAAVLARTAQTGSKELFGYISVKAGTNAEQVRSLLARSLPNYMIPAYIIEMETLPLTSNGKLNRKALPEPDVASKQTYIPPRNELEEQLALIWQEVLGIQRIGIEDSFFELGGDSIKALQVSARLGRYGLSLQVSDLFRHPKIKDLSPFIRKSERIIEQGPIQGDVPWTPVQQWFFSQDIEERHHFNQSVMLFHSGRLSENALRPALKKLAEHHDALRMVYRNDDRRWIQINQGIHESQLYSLRISDLSQSESGWETKIKQEVADLQQSINLQEGPLLHAALFKTLTGDYLFLAIHHLVVDGVSWRILLEDLSAGYQQAAAGQTIQLPPKTDSYQEYARRIQEYAQSSKLIREEAYWRSVEEQQAAELPYEIPHHVNIDFSKRDSLSFSLTEADTAVLLQNVNHAYGTDTQDILLTAASLAICEWTGGSKLRIAMEGHGREHILPELDISRTVGWFTSMYPALISFENHRDELGTSVKTVKDTLGRIPNKGVGYGMLKYLTHPENKSITFSKTPEISFNYLGQFNDIERQDTFRPSSLGSGKDITHTWKREQIIEMSAMAADKKLHFNLSYPPARFHRNTMEQLINRIEHFLLDIMKHCAGQQKAEKTLSDFSSQSLTAEDLDSISSLVEEL